MFWLLGMATGMGILLGLWLRVPSVLAVSGVLVALCIAAMPLTQWSLLTTAAFIFAVLGALQGGYLAGLVLSCAWTQARSLAHTADYRH